MTEVSTYLDLTAVTNSVSPIDNTFLVFNLLLNVNNSILIIKVDKSSGKCCNNNNFLMGESSKTSEICPLSISSTLPIYIYVSLSGRNMSLSASGQLWQYYTMLAGICNACQYV